MKPSVWAGYLLGRGDSIRELADNRATIWTGIGLVLLTSIARNYDQTFIAEKPFLWLFGSLLFSLVSGTWLYLILYGWFVRRATADADGKKPEFWGRWRSFMGLFWMTAPVAWLYAIPVERFFDSLTAAKANLTLLGIVSLWRVVLMARVIQVLTGARYYAVLLWVLFAAAVEILVVFFFGGAFARAIMSGMGGMRNSPEEALMVNTLAGVFMVAFWGTPVILVAALVAGGNQTADDLPAPVKSEWKGRWLLIGALLWVAVAIAPQMELSRNVKVERWFAEGRFRDALDYLSAHQSGQFAPARVLAPNAFEYEIFTELPACLGVVQPNDAPWVREHLLRRLNQMMTHYQRWRSVEKTSPEEQVELYRSGLDSYHNSVSGLSDMLDGLARIPEGEAWLGTNVAFVQAVKQVVAKVPTSEPQPTVSTNLPPTAP
jgi:hypothetical protein